MEIQDFNSPKTISTDNLLKLLKYSEYSSFESNYYSLNSYYDFISLNDSSVELIFNLDPVWGFNDFSSCNLLIDSNSLGNPDDLVLNVSGNIFNQSSSNFFSGNYLVDSSYDGVYENLIVLDGGIFTFQNPVAD